MNLGIDGVEGIRRERAKQRAKWGDEHDDGHRDSELIFNALVLLHFVAFGTRVSDPWNLIAKHKRPESKLRAAGALIAAEIDRRKRAAKRARMK